MNTGRYRKRNVGGQEGRHKTDRQKVAANRKAARDAILQALQGEIHPVRTTGLRDFIIARGGPALGLAAVKEARSELVAKGTLTEWNEPNGLATCRPVVILTSALGDRRKAAEQGALVGRKVVRDAIVRALRKERRPVPTTELHDFIIARGAPGLERQVVTEARRVLVSTGTLTEWNEPTDTGGDRRVVMLTKTYRVRAAIIAATREHQHLRITALRDVVSHRIGYRSGPVFEDLCSDLYTEPPDDIDATQKSDQTVHFALDGHHYEINLSTENAARLRSTLTNYIDHARRQYRRETNQ